LSHSAQRTDRNLENVFISTCVTLSPWQTYRVADLRRMMTDGVLRLYPWSGSRGVTGFVPGG
jgi:hypothetical protein